jgi:hypothetical protein
MEDEENRLALIHAMLHTSPRREERKVDDQQQSRWRPTTGRLLLAGAGVALMIGAVLIGYGYDITLWDWLKLLVVPAVIAGGGLWFNRQQRERELDIAERRTQDEALQAYLDQMSGMLLPNKDQPSLYKARPGDSLSSVARARTLTVLPRLDGGGKVRVVQFLYESGLIYSTRPVLALSGADLSEAFLIDADLSGAILIDADLSDVKRVVNEQLSAASSLDGATMPDGTTLKSAVNPDGPTFEDWLKDREGRGEDGENE